MDEIEQARVGAMESKQFGNAANASKAKGVLSGHWVERKEVGAPGDFDHLTDEELERMLYERFTALGFNADVSLTAPDAPGLTTPNAESTKH